MKLSIIGVLLTFLTFGALSAQEADLKVAFVDSDSILISMPEYPTQMKIYESYAKQLQSQLESKRNEFQQKYQEFQQQAASWIPEVLQDKQKELQQLNQNLQEFAQQSQGSLQQKEKQLLQPLLEKINVAIEDVAQTNDYDYVVESQMFLYSVPKYDITGDVITKLGGTTTGGK